jgi:phosphoketolase
MSLPSANDERDEPDAVRGSCGDFPTLETLAAAAILRERLPEQLVRIVIDRAPGLTETAGRLRQEISDRRIRARAYTREHGEDDPEIRASV